MIRVEVVRHPSAWPFGGYREIQNPARRYSIIDQKALFSIYGAGAPARFRDEHKHWIEEAVNNGGAVKGPAWSESIAAGGRKFVTEIKGKLGIKAMGRMVIKSDENYTLKEPQISYDTLFTPKMAALSLKNTYLWDIYADITIG